MESKRNNPPRPKLWTPEARGLWLPGRAGRIERQAAKPQRIPNRAEIRAFLQQRKTRRDDSPLTKPSLAARVAVRRRRNRCARAARRFNRKEN